MQAAVDITFPYVHAREAFDEKIGKFQVCFYHTRFVAKYSSLQLIYESRRQSILTDFASGWL